MKPTLMSLSVELRRIDDVDYQCSALVALGRHKHLLLEKECHSPVPCKISGMSRRGVIPFRHRAFNLWVQ